jgi:hypothetical protein
MSLGKSPTTATELLLAGVITAQLLSSVRNVYGRLASYAFGILIAAPQQRPWLSS